MDIQMIIVKVVVIVAVLAVCRWVWRKVRRKGNCCDCGCGGKGGHKKSCR